MKPEAYSEKFTEVRRKVRGDSEIMQNGAVWFYPFFAGFLRGGEILHGRSISKGGVGHVRGCRRLGIALSGSKSRFCPLQIIPSLCHHYLIHLTVARPGKL